MTVRQVGFIGNKNLLKYKRERGRCGPSPKFGPCILKFPNYRHYIVTTSTIRGETLPVILCCNNFRGFFLVKNQFCLVLNVPFIGSPRASLQIYETFLSAVVNL